jgi:hypothetical protein
MTAGRHADLWPGDGDGGNMRDQERADRGAGAGQLPGAGDTSRRTFVLGGAAIGVAGMVGGRRAARFSVRERRSEVAAGHSVPQAGSKAEVGATVSAGNPGGSDRLAAAQLFDQNMGGRKTAMSVERFYWGPGEWTIGPGTQEMISNGVAMVASFTPNSTLMQSEITNLSNALQSLKSLKAAVHAVCLTHEANDQKFPTSGKYQSYIDYYGPTVIQAGYNLAYIPLVTQNQNIGAYYPTGTYNGQPMITRMYGDLYCTAYDNGANLDEFFSVATSNNTPRVGIGEFGISGNGTNPGDTPFDEFCGYLISEFQAWNNAGHDSAAIMYFTNGPTNNPDPANYISLEKLWDALSVDA